MHKQTMLCKPKSEKTPKLFYANELLSVKAKLSKAL